MAKSEKQRAQQKARRPGEHSNRGLRKGQGALRPGSALRKSSSSAKTGRTGPQGQKDVKEKGSHFRTENTIKRLNMYKSKAPKAHVRREQATGPVRIQPDRRWFGNTRVIAQDKMQAFRETLTKGVQDPFSVVLRSSKLPMSLLKETEDKASRMNLLSVEPFKEVFSKGRRQKRVKLGSYDLAGLMQSVSQKTQGYNEEKDKKFDAGADDGFEKVAKTGVKGEIIFDVGTSRRIWGELYKVTDASDVLVFVLDARDPMGTRCLQLEREVRKKTPGKHIVLLLNKVDLIPTWAARRWVQVLTKEFPTLAFHASITNPFGKNALLNLLRQFGVLIKERKHLTIGFIGYPNVGKSSVINTMKRKKVCKAAPVPGETKVWQYIALTRKLYMLDCPGIVPPTSKDFQSDCAKLLKGVVRAERVDNPSDFMDEVLARVKKCYLIQRYKLDADTTWTDGEDFLSVLANKMGKLKKGGEPDIETAARIVIYDWQRGRIPFFTMPPEDGEAPSVNGPSASSSSSTANPAATEGAGEQAAITDSSPAPAEEATSGRETLQVRQSLSELACSMAFDEEDRRGDPLPEEKEVPVDKAEAKEAKVKARRKKRSLKEAGLSKEESAAGDGVEGADSSANAGPKKKLRKKKRAASSSGKKEAMTVREGSMDWKAAVAEFDM